jgi:hypothetical protein
MIGLSLSFCVKDILTGKIDLSAVDKIITGTKIEKPEHMEEVVEHYSSVYWNRDPKAISILNELWRSGRIEQPRVSGNEARNISQGHWLDNNGEQIRL